MRKELIASPFQLWLFWQPSTMLWVFGFTWTMLLQKGLLPWLDAKIIFFGFSNYLHSSSRRNKVFFWYSTADPSVCCLNIACCLTLMSYKHRNNCSFRMINCVLLRFIAGKRHWKQRDWGHNKSAHDPAISPHSAISGTTPVRDEGPTQRRHPLLFRGFAPCQQTPVSKMRLTWAENKAEDSALWRRKKKAFTDPLKICKRKPSCSVTCKCNRRWESISSIIHNIYASCF